LTGVLDEYPGAAAAYSLRLLNTDYTGDAIVVRRASDNATQSIGFIDGELDTDTLNTFCSGTDGFVATWYDQSGNGFNVTNTTASRQPKIFDSANGIVLENGKPTIEFDGSKTFTTTATISNASDYYMFYVRNKTVAETGYLLHSETGQLIIEVFEYAAYLDPVNSIEGTGILEGHKLVHFELNSTTGGKVYENSINTQTGLNYSQTAISSKTAIGGIYAGEGDFIGNIQELIIYNTNQSSNRTGIETNINNFYSIY